MSAHQGAIVEMKAGQTVPKAFVEILMDACKSSIGAATSDKDGLMVTVSREAMTVDEMMQVIEGGKGQTALFHFADFPADFMAEDMQPFSILRDPKDNHLVAALVEGDFSAYDQPKSNRSAEWFFCQEVLIPKVTQFYNMVGQDLPRLIANLQSPLVKKEMSALMSGRGSIALMSADGTIIHYDNENEDQSEFDWGWASRTFDYTEQRAGENPNDKKSPLSFFKKAKDGATPPSDPPAPPITPPADTPKPVEPAVKDLPPGVGFSNKDPDDPYYFYQCPDNIKGKNERRDKYKEKTGVDKPPSGYQNVPGPKVRVTKGMPIYAELEKKALIEAGAASPIKTSDTNVHHLPGPVDTTHKPGSLSHIPLLSGNEKKELNEWLVSGEIKKTVDANSRVIDDPKALQEQEKKYPSYIEIAGLQSIVGTFAYPFDLRVQMAKKHPQAAALLQLNLTVQLASALAELAKLHAEKKGHDEAPPADPVKKTGTDDAPVAPPAAPSNKGFFKKPRNPAM